MPLHTRGFLNTRQLNRHFVEHGTEFGLATMTEYEDAADVFLGGMKPPHVVECTRSRGDRVRFDPISDAYGVLDVNGVIRTYFKPIPCANVPRPRVATARLAGRCHDERSNLDYFRTRCAKW